MSASPWRWLGRATWGALAATCVALLLLLVPINLGTIQLDWQFQAMYPVVSPYVSRPVFAAYTMGLKYFVALVCVVTSAVIAWRRADDRMAWLAAVVLVVIPIAFSLGGYSETWSYYPRPWREWFHATRDLLAGIGGSFGLTAFMFLFPTGRFVTRGFTWAFVGFTLLQGVLTGWLYFIESEGGVFYVWLATLLAGLIVAAAGQVYRYRRVSSALERQQSKWVVTGLVCCVSALATTTVLNVWAAGTPYEALTMLVANHAQVFVLAFLPLALAFSILRYRLWDIDLLVNRALVYAALTTCVVGLYVALVGGLGAVFQLSGSPALAVVATGLVALLFQPLRQRVQTGANRLVYGARDDPATALAQLGRSLEATLVPDQVLATIVATVAQALKLPYVAVAVAEGGAFTVLAEHGQPAPGVERAESPKGEPAGLLAFPLAVHAQIIGELRVAPRGPGESFSAADRRLLSDLARQAAPAVHAYCLAADLQRSRERLVLAREEERRRLRRDLHDGLGPTLASQALKLDAALDLLAQDPATATRYLHEVKAQTQSTVADIRRLVYALRPPLLDELGLVGALRAHVQSLVPAHGLRLTVAAPDALPSLPAAVEVAAYRIALEALTNVVRHARASECQVSLAVAGEQLQLEVVDDGAGLPEDMRSGLGLASMRARAGELGGRCTIEPAPAGGTRVCVALPLEPAGHG